MRTTILFLLIMHVAVGKKTYFMPYLMTNWYKAYEFCISLGQRLATIESEAENDAIIEFVKNSDKYVEYGRFWIGASDLAEEGTFTWTFTNKLLAFKMWGKDQPSNSDGNENCAQLFHTTGADWMWNDDVCEYEHYFICETYKNICNSNSK